MESVLTAVIVCGTLLYVFRQVMPLLQQHVKARVNAPVKNQAPVPNDLMLLASQWSDAWAREQTLKNIQELYDSTGQDWDRVRFLISQQDFNVGTDDS